jgi:hypothetical protein
MTMIDDAHLYMPIIQKRAHSINISHNAFDINDATGTLGPWKGEKFKLLVTYLFIILIFLLDENDIG